MEIVEVWCYDTAKYDPETKTNNLFSEYVDTFLKTKIAASGYPIDADTEEKREAYIRHCAEVDGFF